MTNVDQHGLTRFGFRFERGGAHLARTMMLDELATLLGYVDRPTATKLDYRQAIVEDNCLGKRSGQNRQLTYRHLADLYALDPSVTLFRALLFFWPRDPAGHRLVALLCAYARDPILRLTAPLIIQSPEGTPIPYAAMAGVIDRSEPERFSNVTLLSAAQHATSTWAQSGHLCGRAPKIRSSAQATSAAVAYALLLSYLTGARGQQLFQTDFAKLLDCSYERAIELAQDASRRGWIVFKRIGDVVEALFPNLLCSSETGATREQS